MGRKRVKRPPFFLSFPVLFIFLSSVLLAFLGSLPCSHQQCQIPRAKAWWPLGIRWSVGHQEVRGNQEFPSDYWSFCLENIGSGISLRSIFSRSCINLSCENQHSRCSRMSVSACYLSSTWFFFPRCSSAFLIGECAFSFTLVVNDYTKEKVIKKAFAMRVLN